MYRLITRGTIEEKIYQRQLFKTLLSNRILSASPEIVQRQKRLFSSQSLHDLFSFEDEDEVVDGQKSLGGSRGLGKEWNHILPLDQVIDGSGMREDEEILGGNGNTFRREEDEGEGESQRDLLQALFDGSDIAAVFSHDYLEEGQSGEEGHRNPQQHGGNYERLVSTTQEEMDRVTQQALDALWKDREERNRGLSFGLGSIGGSEQVNGRGASFIPRFGGSSSTSSSVSLISNLRLINGTSSSSSLSNPSTHISIMKKLDELLRFGPPNAPGGGVPSHILLEHFSQLPDSYAPLFRQLLQSIATLGPDKRWRLK